MIKLKKMFSGMAIGVLVLLVVWFPNSISASTKPQHVKGQILVKFKDGTDGKSASRELDAHGAKIKQELSQIKVHIVSVPEGKESNVVERLSKNPKVEFAELDVIGSATSADPLFGRQYGLENTGQMINTDVTAGKPDADIDAPEAWAITRGNGIRVAILDSGVDQDHPDLSSKLVAQRNFSSNNINDVEDIYGHGTHVAGIVAATTDNNTGVASVCPDCTIMNGKVLNNDGYGAASWAANGINWAADNGAKVINMSIGFRQSSKTMEAAVNRAWNRGVVLVASAGNNSNTAKEYPGAYTNVIAVAATNNKDAKASFSTYSSRWVDIAAPGENVFSTFPNHPFVIQSKYGRALNYDYANGTSMSSPMVAGVAGLVWSQMGTSTSAQSVRSRIESTADRIPGTGSYWSAGRVNAARAVGAQVN